MCGAAARAGYFLPILSNDGPILHSFARLSQRLGHDLIPSYPLVSTFRPCSSQFTRFNPNMRFIRFRKLAQLCDRLYGLLRFFVPRCINTCSSSSFGSQPK
jgi:hypothetical protein